MKIGMKFKSFHIFQWIFLNYLMLESRLVRGSLVEVKIAKKCMESELEECSSRAESLIKNRGLFFPDKPTTLDRVCRTWENLTVCIHNYTSKCYSGVEKAKFDRVFNESIPSMTLVCNDQAYRNDYLKYAPCVKKVTTDGNYCGYPYQVLMDHISNSQVTMKQLCCTGMKFKSCILSKTKQLCMTEGKGSGRLDERTPVGSLSVKPMNITTFVEQVVDKSLRFIAQECGKVRTSFEDCEMGNSLLLRPNSKGPLAIDKAVQSHSSDEPINSSSLNNKFQNGEKVSGNSWNRINQAQADKSAPNSQSTGNVNLTELISNFVTITGLSPKATETKAKENSYSDKLLNPGAGLGSASTEPLDLSGNQPLPSTFIFLFSLFPLILLT